MKKQMRMRLGLSLGVGLTVASALTAAADAALAAAEAEETRDDLAGLRPSTDGVETNAFWDTRAHVSYSVCLSEGANTNGLSSAVSTHEISGAGDIAEELGLSVIIR